MTSIGEKMFKVYVDGQHGTTGLLVNERLEKHPLVEILEIPFEERHNKALRIELLNKADVVFLCLPDDAAKESASLVTNSKTKIIDASTAHRTHDDWVYGLPELSKNHLELIKGSQHLSNPGCHASASIAALYPLVSKGIISKELQISIFSITGYSGGGKQMIHKYEHTDSMAYKAPRQYALSLEHKHVPEIMKRAGLVKKPIFMPVVSNFARGLAVTIPLAIDQLNKPMDKNQLVKFYKEYYKDAHYINVHDADNMDELVDNCMHIQGSNDTNYLDLFVYGNEEQIQIIARLDNLGKGASGAAIQNMNIMLGIDETTGLN